MKYIARVFNYFCLSSIKWYRNFYFLCEFEGRVYLCVLLGGMDKRRLPVPVL